MKSVNDIRIGCAMIDGHQPFWAILAHGVRERAQALGLTVSIVTASYAAEQVEAITQLLQHPCDALIIAPVDTQALIAIVQQVNAAGIPVITVNAAIDGVELASTVEIDNTRSAELAATYVAERLQGRGAVVHLRGAHAEHRSKVADDRSQGVHNVIARHPGMRIVFEGGGDWSREAGAALMRAALTAHPDIQAVFAANDPMALGAIDVIEDMGRTGHILVAGHDGLPDALLAIHTGKMAVTVRQTPREMGHMVVDVALRVVRGESVPSRIFVETVLLTRDNLLNAALDAVDMLPGIIADLMSTRAIESERHQREQRRRIMLERVVRAGKAMTQTADLRTCLLHIRNSIQRELDFDRVGIFLYDAEQKIISGSYGTDRAGGLTEEWDVVGPIAAHSPYQLVISQPDGFLFTNDFEADFAPRPEIGMAGVKQHAMVGVWATGRPIAILAVDNLLTQRPITEEQLEALRLSAGYAGLAIENARLLDQARQAEQLYRAIFENSMEGIAQTSLDGRFLSANPAQARILGYASPEELLASLTNIQHQVFVDPTRYDELMRLLEEQGVVWNFEYQIRRKDGSLAWVSLNARLVHTGARPFIEGTWQDITERRQLEAQLLKSQKMEAVGQLAGGIAHDFNNLLVVIASSTDFASDALSPNDPIQTDLRQIQRAAERAANLTRQLLTFARRQISTLQILNLNDLIREIDTLLRHLIREDIILQTALALDLWPVHADPGQIEQVLMNLVINARDAMPQGGRLTIESCNVVLDPAYVRTSPTVVPGPYVLLAVTDTGMGMSTEIVQHAFEPFFTTKEPGQGTGLGLATCYGIIKQHGGNIELYSEVGQGTSVKVYLPRAAGAVAAPITEREPNPLPRGTETVLLVEDEPVVRALTVRILRRQGYTVLEAGNGVEALDMIRRGTHPPIDLLLTDMIMPKLGGYELAEQLAAIVPGIRVLFMSGYTANAVIQNGLLDRTVTFIQKPFTPAALAHSVRALLDR